MSAAVALRSAPPAMTPGTYLRLRREAAGLSLLSLARLVTSSPVDVDAAVDALACAEADRGLLGDADLSRLAPLTRIEFRVYGALIDGQPAYGVCQVCGCSHWSSCPGGCWWADGDRTICTACVDRRP